MKAYFLNCSSNQTNYNLCLEHQKAGFKFNAPQPGDLVYLILKKADGNWHCGARGVLRSPSSNKPWPDSEQYTSCFDISWELCEPFSISQGLREIYSNYGLALQPAKVLFDSIQPETSFENQGSKFMAFMEANFQPLNESLYPVVERFVAQARTANLKVADYPQSFLGLDINVSFGKGNQARIPWISLLAPGHITSCGIYPVYLLYKSVNKLILAYGVSETNRPPFEWEVSSPTIADFFSNHGLGDPERYHRSQIFKVYDLELPLTASEIDRDIYKLVSEYKSRLASSTQDQTSALKTRTSSTAPFSCTAFYDDLRAAGLFYSESLVYRFCASLLTKPFVILTGLSGSGKTRLATSLARWLCADEAQFCTVAVGADWTNRDPLLGYPNALEANRYVLPETGALSLILEAAKPENRNRPFFLILDEMNLSHVERYFADFLSAMESACPIRLHSGQTSWNDNIPASILIPSNLFIIGTVNVDETTYMFSPKVLDRAHVIEFRVSPNEMEEFLTAGANLTPTTLAARGADMASSFLGFATGHYPPQGNSDVNEVLLSFFSELQPLGAEFGYRSAEVILRFIALAKQISPGWNITDILDAAIIQKLLPKVHGSRRRLESVLGGIAALCVIEQQPRELLLGEQVLPAQNVRFPLTLDKTRRMYRAVCANGFASFAEA